MRVVDLARAPHEVHGDQLHYRDGGHRYRVKMPVKAAVVDVVEQTGGLRSTITFGTLARAVLQVTGPTTTIDRIFDACGGRTS